MAADGYLLQGEVFEDPKTSEIDVERMILGFLRALAQELRQEGK